MSLRADTSSSSSSSQRKNASTGVESEDGHRRRRAGGFNMIWKNILPGKPSFSKKRKLFRADTSSPMPTEGPPFPVYISDAEYDVIMAKAQTIPAMKQGLLSDDPAAQLEATTQFGKLLSGGHIYLIDKVKQADVVPRFVQFLTRDDMPQLQSMAAWTLTNIAAGLSEHTNTVIEHGAVPLLVQLLSSGCDDGKEQALWALGNIAGNSLTARDLVLNNGALSPLLSLLWNPSTKKSTWRIAIWAFVNIIREKPPLTLEDQILPALSGLRELLLMPDESVQLYACSILYWLTQDCSDEMVQAIVEGNFCPRLVELLLYPESKVVVPALQVLGEIASGNDAQTQVLINCGALRCLKDLLTQSDKIILEEACYVILNIAGGNIAQKQDVIDADLISSLVRLTKADFDIRKEALWAISNVTEGTHEHIR
ncbi:importin subunit alpha [Medicago truncatula]|uniref:Importin subunit alpha n=1 Tax=Medicago truncatula TaxID=3880 RepID=G7KYM8_MEDTR|nr:importin subunit alpha [Medicago truncatula]